MEFVRSDAYDIACNWKVYVDNFLEGYHLPYVHPGLSKVLDYRVYSTELFPWQSLQHSPLKANDGIYGDGEAFYYFVYPNVMLNIMPGRLQVNRVLPAGPDRCRVEFDYYYAPDSAARARIGRDREFSDEIQQEDIAICEAVQRGLASGHYEPGRLCPRRESGLWHFQNLLRGRLLGANGGIRLSEKAAAGRELGPWMATALVVGNVIGMGIFMQPASLAPYGFNAFIAWIIDRRRLRRAGAGVRDAGAASAAC